MSVTAQQIIVELKSLGNDSYKKTMLKHGVKEPFFGVKVEDLKKIQKRIKKDYRLALELYDTGISDAMYLAGLIADDARMTRKDLEHWVEKANSPLHREYTVPWVAAGSPAGSALALEWIESKNEDVAASGWATLSSWVSITDDGSLDQGKLKQLLERVAKTIHQASNRVRHTMNGFVIAVGSYVSALSELALQTAEQIGPVSVDMGDTACEVPSAARAITKLQQRGKIGQKRKSAKC
jgi:3-methyladenine DNA glycosylase AlkD